MSGLRFEEPGAPALARRPDGVDRSYAETIRFEDPPGLRGWGSVSAFYATNPEARRIAAWAVATFGPDGAAVWLGEHGPFAAAGGVL